MAEKSAYKSLQNGSDIRGIAVDGVVGEKVNLTPERVAQIGGAFAAFFARTNEKIAPRLTSYSRHRFPYFGTRRKDGLLSRLVRCRHRGS